MQRSFRSIALSIAILSALTVAAPLARAQAVAQFDLPEQPLADSLRAIAKQTNSNVLFDRKLVRGRTAPALKTQGTLDAALMQLLDGSGLKHQFVDDKTVTVVDPTKPAASRRSEAEAAADSRPTASNLASPAAGTNGYTRIAQADERPLASSEVSTDAPVTLSQRIELEEIVVTGTHIRGVTPESSPLTIYDRADIDASGAATVDQFVKTMPQNFALLDGETFLNNGGDTAALSNSARGSTVDLHGLGAGATLVLLNGRRLSPAGADGSFIDISMIPLSAIERVEVLGGGASALYGADAVAGVVNFVLRRDFDGAETGLLYGDTSRGGSEQLGASQLLGTSWDTGNALLVYEYYDQNELRTSQRDFIPDQGGDFAVIPGQRRQSVVTSVRQGILPRTDIFADAFFSERDFEQDYTSRSVGGVEIQEWGRAQTYGISAGMGQGLGRDWHVELSGNYAATDEVRRGTVLGSPFEDPTDSHVLALDLRADGPIFAAPGGTARASIGAASRRERFGGLNANDEFDRTERRVTGAYAELFIPLIGDDNARPWAQRLELSMAGRYDDYEEMGSSTDPKIGLLWAPLRGLKLRGTYAESFRVPPLAQLNDAQQYLIQRLPDPAAADGVTITMIPAAPGNPQLGPEESESLTLGLDIDPPGVSGLSLSATYFRIDYRDRIARPFVVGSPFFTRDALAPFIQMPADPAEIQRIFAEETFFDLSGIPGGATPASIEAFFDQRLQNIAATRTSGVDLTTRYELGSRFGQMTFFLAGSYLLESDFRASAASPSASLVNKLYHPMDLRLRGGIAWSRGGFSSSLTGNYSDNYQNNLRVPAGVVDSWATADWQLSYQTGRKAGGFLGGLSLTLLVQNLTDEDPPLVATTLRRQLGFDSANASPRGRFVSLRVRKQW